MSTRDAWRGDDQQQPKFGRKAREWFRRSVHRGLYDPPDGFQMHGLKPECRDFRERLADRLSLDPMPCVRWVDDKEYRGSSWSHGGWIIDWDAVFERTKEALAEIRLELETSKYPTLDDWLRAEVAGTLATKGERGGAGALPKKLRRELQSAARARRKALPKVCTSCGELYQPTCNRAQRCQRCIRGPVAETRRGRKRSGN